jgi:plastocyanin
MAFRWRIVPVLGLALLFLAWAGTAGAIFGTPGSPGSARALTTAASTGVDWLNVTVSSGFTFTIATAPSPNAEVSPGDTVHVELTQTGTTAHTFTLSPTAGFTFPTSDQTSDLVSYFAMNKPLVNINVTGTQGDRAFANFTAPSAGQYEYVCLEAGHFGLGMHGELGSGEAGAGAGPAPYNGPGAPVFIIAGVITALVIIALVLGFVIGKRRGSTDEMPPERLGYPEPPSSNPKP